jgi:predicted RNA-binding Zn ribbon-like protein
MPADVRCALAHHGPASPTGQSQYGQLRSTGPPCTNGLVHFNHYGGTAAQLAVALVNAPATVAGYQAVVDEYTQPTSVVSEEHTVALAAWADRLLAAFTEPDLDRRVHTINALLAAAASRPFISRHDGMAPHLHYAGVADDIVTRLRARTAAGLAHLLCEDGPDRFGCCERAGCGAVFVDTSRNGRRRFCSLRCANRVRVAEHRVRTAEVTGGGPTRRPSAR